MTTALHSTKLVLVKAASCKLTLMMLCIEQEVHYKLGFLTRYQQHVLTWHSLIASRSLGAAISHLSSLCTPARHCPLDQYSSACTQQHAAQSTIEPNELACLSTANFSYKHKMVVLGVVSALLPEHKLYRARHLVLLLRYDSLLQDCQQ
jgi:hypothetical protein